MSAKPTDEQSSMRTALIVMGILGLIVAGIIFYYVSHQPAPVTTTAPPVAPPPAPVDNREKLATTEFLRIQNLVDAALAQRQWAGATRLCSQFDRTQYAGTSAIGLLDQLTARVLTAATDDWNTTATEVRQLRDAHRYADALALCDKTAGNFQGLDAITRQIETSRTEINQAQQENTRAREKSALVLAALEASVPGWIINGQWTDYQRGVQKALGNVGPDPAIRQVFQPYQAEADQLVALQQAVLNRVRTQPGPALNVPLRQGRVEGNLISVDATQFTVRQAIGGAGYAEVKTAWADVPPLGLARFYQATYNRTLPDEALAFAALLTHLVETNVVQATAALAAVDAFTALAPARAAEAKRYELLIAALSLRTPAPVAIAKPPTPTPSTPAVNPDFAKYPQTFTLPRNDFSFTGKVLATDPQQRIIIVSSGATTTDTSPVVWLRPVGMCRYNTFAHPHGQMPAPDFKDIKVGMLISASCRVGLGNQVIATTITEINIVTTPKGPAAPAR